MDEQELLKERFKSAVSSTVKAISENFDLEIKFGRNLSSKKNSLNLPEIVSLKKLEDFDLENVSSKGYSFFMETIFLINKNGYKIDEIPIFFTDRLKGVSKIPRIEIIRTFFNVIKLKFFK